MRFAACRLGWRNICSRCCTKRRRQPPCPTRCRHLGAAVAAAAVGSPRRHRCRHAVLSTRGQSRVGVGGSTGYDDDAPQYSSPCHFPLLAIPARDRVIVCVAKRACLVAKRARRRLRRGNGIRATSQGTTQWQPTSARWASVCAVRGRTGLTSNRRRHWDAASWRRSRVCSMQCRGACTTKRASDLRSCATPLLAARCAPLLCMHGSPFFCARPAPLLPPPVHHECSCLEQLHGGRLKTASLEPYFERIGHHLESLYVARAPDGAKQPSYRDAKNRKCAVTLVQSSAQP
jgi:hypothetical protein|eukprot:COSAG01_NODE_3257_length_6345_cov_4.979987_1_plen_289_part_00